jgi:hypothetical protein
MITSVFYFIAKFKFLSSFAERAKDFARVSVWGYDVLFAFLNPAEVHTLSTLLVSTS